MSEAAFTICRLEEKVCDAVIMVNGVEFNAHKDILCNCSPYFSALFTSGRRLSETRVYNIPGLAAEMMCLIIEYAYTGCLTINEENVEELLVAADYLSVTGITRACCQFLEAHLCVENCISIWRFADFYSCWELQRKAYQFIECHFDEIVCVSGDFLELPLVQQQSV